MEGQYKTQEMKIKITQILKFEILKCWNKNLLYYKSKFQNSLTPQINQMKDTNETHEKIQWNYDKLSPSEYSHHFFQLTRSILDLIYTYRVELTSINLILSDPFFFKEMSIAIMEK